jgi:NitT/TauT family transport system ATP-binding protein
LSDRIGVMSARPGTIIETIETGWPKERDSRIVSDLRFASITARMWEKLRIETMKTMVSQEGKLQ